MKKIFLTITIIAMAIISSSAQQSVKDIAQLLKSYERILQQYDEGADSIYKSINRQINKQKDNAANSAIWHSCMAQFLMNYYNENQWKIMDRTALAEEGTDADFKTWDAKTFLKQATNHYLKSIENEDLIKYNIQDFIEILDTNYNMKFILSAKYRPSLYDFLAFRVIDALSNTRQFNPIVSDFTYNNDYFSENQNFINIKINSENQYCPEYIILKTLQRLTRLHLQDNSFKSLIYITLNRYQWLTNHFSNSELSSIFLEALSSLEKQYENQDGYEQIAYALGDFYRTRGDKYDKNEHPEYLKDYVTAIDWYQKAINAAPNSIEANNAHSKIEKLKSADLSFKISTYLPAHRSNLMNIIYKNCKSTFLQIYAISEKEFNDYRNIESQIKTLEKKTPVWQKEITLPDDGLYREKEGYLMLPELEHGHYLIVTSPTKKLDAKHIAYNFIQISSFGATWKHNDDQLEILVFDCLSGKPINGAKINVSISQNYNKKQVQNQVLQSDVNGKCTIPIQNQRYVSVTAQYKGYSIEVFDNHYFYDNKSSNKSFEHIFLFTDREIYRPGQTIYFKGIISEEERENGETKLQRLLAYKSVKVTLKDANYQDINEITLTSNEYGSFFGSFVLPENVLTGRFTLQTDKQSRTIQVEEYKRPTFEITFEQPKSSFKLGQEVEIEGDAKAYAGYGIAGATVKYNITRKAIFRWWSWWHPQVPKAEIAHGEVIADDNGHFKINFEAKDVPTANKYNPLYLFEVKAVVTDINGETHEASTTLRISKIALQIEAEIPETVESGQNARFSAKLTNLAGKTQNGQIHYTIEALATPEQYLNPCPEADLFLSDSDQMIKQLPFYDLQNQKDFHQWKVLKLVNSGDINSSDSSALIIENLKKFAEGYYKITLTAEDNEQNKVENSFFLLVYQQNSNKCAVYEPIFIEKTDKKAAEVGDIIHFTIGSYLKDANILLEISSNGTLIESRWVKCNRGKFDYSYKVEEKDLGIIKISAFLAQNGFQYVKTESVDVIDTKKKIDFDFITFRDKTQPGSKEQYQIRLKNKEGEAIAAELLCSMYDISLDALSKSTNSFDIDINYWHRDSYDFFHQKRLQDFYNANSNFLNNYTYSFVDFNFPYLKWNINMFRRKQARMYAMAAGPAANKAVEFNDAAVEESAVLADVEFVESAEEIEEPEEVAEDNSMIRSNFAETAFFYPQLKTDANGNIVISFTMPESLTRWKLQGFAHNTNMMQGYFCKFIETQKPLMVVPNAPRFFREGDELSFSAKIVNLSEVTQTGNIQLTLTDALTGEVLSIIEGADNQSFTVEAGKSVENNFTLKIPFGVGVITYRIEAHNNQTPSYGDGEEATLPVLSNRILVKESMPIAISGIGAKSFTFKKLKESFEDSKSTLTTQSLTLDFTPNPIWYAIQSLPYLMEYPYECNEQIFSRLYANTLAHDILSSHSRIKEIFEKWQNENPDAFCSQLEKNQELKSVILEETPWLLDAQNESQQKQNLAVLFDFTRMSRECEKASQQLQKAQKADGGWSWFSGGESSPFVTRHIIAGCGHLKALGINSVLSKSTIEKAISFIDKNEKEYYDKYIKKDKPCEVENIHYLYARSFFLEKNIPSSCSEAYDYFYSNLKKNWKKSSFYSQAMAALIFYRNGDKKLAEEVVVHLKSFAQYSEEMGMFWKKEGDGYFWYEAPIERQALMIEAFHTITQDKVSVEKMQLWLLKQRQTQNWPTTKATTEACYALMLNNTQITNEKGVKLSLGNWHYEEGDGTMEAEAGSGYIKKSWTGNEVKADMSTLAVEKSTKGPAWGGMYWQYLEDIDKISHSDDRNLQIEKKLFKVGVNSEGEVLEPITEDFPLKAGDKIRVRIIIRSDRDMEYVHLKDMRASAFEPTNVLSGYRHQEGLWYYEATSDAATNFFIDYLPKGNYVFEYSLLATMKGTFSNGITTLQCMYAPEFSSHSEGIRIKVK